MPVTWNHSFTPSAASTAYERAAVRVLAGHPVFAADVCALVFADFARAEEMRGAYPVDREGTATLTVGGPTSFPGLHLDWKDATTTAARTWELLAKQAGINTKAGLPERFTTFEKPPATFDTAALPAWLTVVVVAAVAGAALYCVHQASTVVDRALSRNEDSKRLLVAHQKLADLVDSHHEREREAQKPLPLSEAEKAALEALKAVQGQIAAKVDTPMPGTVGGLSSGATWGLVLAAVLTGAYFLTD